MMLHIYVDTEMSILNQRRKLSLAGLAKLSRLTNSWLRFGLASACYRGLGVHDRPVYTAGYLTADFTEQYEIPGVSPLSLAERGLLTQFSDWFDSVLSCTIVHTVIMNCCSWGLLEKRAERRLRGGACMSHPWLLTADTIDVTDTIQDTILDTARLRGYVIYQCSKSILI